MKRRVFVAGSAASSAAAFETTQKKSNSLVELRYYKLRNTMDGMPKRLNEFLSTQHLPALQRAGISKVGFFGNLIGGGSPYVLQVTEYKNLAQLEATWEALNADSSYKPGSTDYVRIETTLLRSFDGLPSIEMPK